MNVCPFCPPAFIRSRRPHLDPRWEPTLHSDSVLPGFKNWARDKTEVDRCMTRERSTMQDGKARGEDRTLGHYRLRAHTAPLGHTAKPSGMDRCADLTHARVKPLVARAVWGPEAVRRPGGRERFWQSQCAGRFAGKPWHLHPDGRL